MNNTLHEKNEMSLKTDISIDHKTLMGELEAFARELPGHPFLISLEKTQLSIKEIKILVSEQFGYNFYFLKALINMRLQFRRYKKFIRYFLDPHISTELGSDLGSVGLYQTGETHVSMVYSLSESLSMTEEELDNWGPYAQKFFEKALIELIGGENFGKALGAAYADEIFASIWFPCYYKGFKRYCSQTGTNIDLEFFECHANEIEPAHVKHAAYLIDFCLEEEFQLHDFIDGYKAFYKLLTNKFDGLYHTIS